MLTFLVRAAERSVNYPRTWQIAQQRGVRAVVAECCRSTVDVLGCAWEVSGHPQSINTVVVVVLKQRAGFLSSLNRVPWLGAF